MNAPITVTNYDFTPAACIARLEHLLQSEPLLLRASGGGLGEAQELVFRHCALIAIDEIRECLRHLRDALVAQPTTVQQADGDAR